LGWIGTEKRLEYTAIGDSVNTAMRIQENAAKDQILISKEACERVEEVVQANPCAPLHVTEPASLIFTSTTGVIVSLAPASRITLPP
jgi:adenylate cyclase